MLLRRTTCLCLLLLLFSSVLSQVKTIQAVKTDHPPLIDGILDDAVWKDLPVASGFIQNFPSYGAAASQRTEVKITYDNFAIYIGAHLYDDPSLIRRQITARDEEQLKDLDYFSVFLDTYHDLQNGFQFLVTSSNVQTDGRLIPNQSFNPGLRTDTRQEASQAADALEYSDKTWDAVWDSKVAIVADGWTVEMKIPYLSLRFSNRDMQTWGLQFLRVVRRNNEASFWNPVSPQVNGLVNQFGILDDLHNIKPPLRLSFSPYVSTGIRSTPEPGDFRKEGLISGGMDVKYGINESFTLDATLIPDFGQVISDNVVNNLTPYEVRFDEYRPFFTEGTEIFDKTGLFYSRRIGAIPSGYETIRDSALSDPNIEILKNPARTNLYNAIKLSGRTKHKLGIGVFNAISAPMYATIRNKTTDEQTRSRTEPFANYNIIVLDQALQGRSYVTFTNTNVIRNGAARDANVSGLDLSLYDKKNRYNLKAYGHYSKTMGDNSSAGYNTQLRFAKVSGAIRYRIENVIRSDEYDPTDLGYLQTNNQNVTTGSVSYNQLTPTRNFLSYTYTLQAQYLRLFRPDRYSGFIVQATGTWVFRNFWDVSLDMMYYPDQHDYFVTGTPFEKYARRPGYGAANLYGSTDSRKRLFVNYNFLISDFFNNPEKKYHVLEGGVRYRFSNKLTMEFTHRYETETDYIVSYHPMPSTGEPRIAFVDFKDVTSVLSGIYNFTPRINLTVRARHYWSHVPVKRIASLDDKGNPVFPPTFLSSVTENVNYFNTDAFLTWDFRYGSRLILGYKNWLGEDETVDGNLYTKYFSNLNQSLKLRYGNELTIRFIYFLDYNQLKNRTR